MKYLGYYSSKIFIRTFLIIFSCSIAAVDSKIDPNEARQAEEEIGQMKVGHSIGHPANKGGGGPENGQFTQKHQRKKGEEGENASGGHSPINDGLPSIFPLNLVKNVKLNKLKERGSIKGEGDDNAPGNYDGPKIAKKKSRMEMKSLRMVKNALGIRKGGKRGNKPPLLGKRKSFSSRMEKVGKILSGGKNENVPPKNGGKSRPKLNEWASKKFASFTLNRRATNNHRQLSNGKKSDGKWGIRQQENGEGWATIGITLEEAIDAIGDIYAIQHYTDYYLDGGEEGENVEEKDTLDNERETKPADRPPFDANNFVGTVLSSKKNVPSKRKNNRGWKFLHKRWNLKNAKKQRHEKGLIVHGAMAHSAMELIKMDGWQHLKEGWNGVERNEEAKYGHNWADKIGRHLAERIDRECALVGKKKKGKGKGEHALCILARLFTFCAAIEKEIEGIEEFHEKFTTEERDKLEWTREAALAIFRHFSPHEKAGMVLNKLAREYNALFKVKSDMRKDYGQIFPSDGKIVKKIDGEWKTWEKKEEVESDEKEDGKKGEEKGEEEEEDEEEVEEEAGWNPGERPFYMIPLKKRDEPISVWAARRARPIQRKRSSSPEDKWKNLERLPMPPGKIGKADNGHTLEKRTKKR